MVSKLKIQKVAFAYAPLSRDCQIKESESIKPSKIQMEFLFANKFANNKTVLGKEHLASTNEINLKNNDYDIKITLLTFNWFEKIINPN